MIFQGVIALKALVLFFKIQVAAVVSVFDIDMWTIGII